MNFVVAVRRAVVVLLLVFGTLTFISGFALVLLPSGPGAGELVFLGLTKHTWEMLHTYVSFPAAGLIVVHLAANVHALKYYLLGKR